MPLPRGVCRASPLSRRRTSLTTTTHTIPCHERFLVPAVPVPCRRSPPEAQGIPGGMALPPPARPRRPTDGRGERHGDRRRSPTVCVDEGLLGRRCALSGPNGRHFCLGGPAVAVCEPPPIASPPITPPARLAPETDTTPAGGTAPPPASVPRGCRAAQCGPHPAQRDGRRFGRWRAGAQ